VINARWLVNSNQGCCHFPHYHGTYMNVLFIIKVKTLVLIRQFPYLLSTIRPRIINIFQAQTTISFEHMPPLYPFLEPHLITHHSNYKFLIKRSNRIRHVCLLLVRVLKTSNSRCSHVSNTKPGFYAITRFSVHGVLRLKPLRLLLTSGSEVAFGGARWREMAFEDTCIRCYECIEVHISCLP